LFPRLLTPDLNVSGHSASKRVFFGPIFVRMRHQGLSAIARVLCLTAESKTMGHSKSKVIRSRNDLDVNVISKMSKSFPGFHWFLLVSWFPETWKGNLVQIWYNFIIIL
jgi:hypothetical protein